MRMIQHSMPLKPLLIVGILYVFPYGLYQACFAEQLQTVSPQEQKDMDFANGLFQRGMYDNAAQQYIEFLQKHPVSPLREQALFRQGESFYQHASKKLSHDPIESKVALLKARAAFQEWLRLYPKEKRLHEVLLRLGEISYKLDDPKKGLPSLERLIKESKDARLLEAALFYAGRCNESLKQYDQAISRYRQIRSTYPKGEFAAISTFLLAEVLAQKGESEKAVREFNDLWQHPDKYNIPKDSNLIVDAQLRSAQLLYQMDKFGDASKAYMQYVKDHPTGEAAAKAKYGAAWAEYRRKNFGRALEIANSLQRQSLPSDMMAGILFLKGTCSYQQKLYDDAILNFREVIADPGAGDYRQRAWYQLAWSYYLSHQYQQAITECENLLKQTLPLDMSSKVHFLLGQSYAQRNDFDSAIKELRVSLRMGKQGEYSEEALYLLADLLYRKGLYKEAGDTFEQYFNTYPQSSRAENALVWATNSRFAGKEYKQAIATADRLIKTFPSVKNKPDILYRKALAQYQLKEYDPAHKTLDEIINASDPGDRRSEALYWKSYIYEIQGNKKAASAFYGQLLKQYPTFKDKEEVRLRKALCDYEIKNYGAAYEGFYAVLFTDRGVRLPAEVIFWMINKADENENHEEALEIAQRIWELFEEPQIKERVLIALGNQYVATKQWKKALNNSDLFLQTFPSSLFKPEIYWSRAKALEGLKEPTKALEWYNKSLEELQKLGNPDATFEATLYMDRGRLLEALNQTGPALESFLRVAIIYDHPKLTPEALYRSIRCHTRLKETKEAKTLHQELLLRYPDSEWAKKAQQELDSSKQ